MTSNIFTSPNSGTVSVASNGIGNPLIKVTDGYVPVIGDTRQAGLDAQNVVPFIAAVVKNSQLAQPDIKKFIADAGKETVVVINNGAEARVYVPTNAATADRNLAMALANLEAHRQWTSGEAQVRIKEAAKPSNELIKFDGKALELYNSLYQTKYVSWGETAGGSGIDPLTIESWRKRAKAAHDKLRTGPDAEAGLADYLAYLGFATKYKTWDDVNNGNGTSDANVMYHIKRAKDKAVTSSSAYKLRNGPDAEAGLADYISTLNAPRARKYKTWADVNSGAGCADSTVKFHIAQAKAKAAAKKAEADKRSDAGLVYYNAQQGTKFGSWADTDLTDPAFIEQWAALAETASKIIAPTKQATFVAPSSSTYSYINSRTHSPLGFEPFAPTMKAPQYLNW